jgi:hypothetical protein
MMVLFKTAVAQPATGKHSDDEKERHPSVIPKVLLE